MVVMQQVSCGSVVNGNVKPVSGVLSGRSTNTAATATVPKHSHLDCNPPVVAVTVLRGGFFFWDATYEILRREIREQQFECSTFQRHWPAVPPDALKSSHIMALPSLTGFTLHIFGWEVSRLGSSGPLSSGDGVTWGGPGGSDSKAVRFGAGHLVTAAYRRGQNHVSKRFEILGNSCSLSRATPAASLLRCIRS